MKGKIILGVLVLILVKMPLAYAAPFQNGSFEFGILNNVASFDLINAPSDVIDNWTVTLGSIAYIGGLWVSSDGVRSIDMNGFAQGVIEQQFDTITGSKYDILFDLAGNPCCSSPLMKRLEVSAAGVSQEFTFDATGRDFNNMGWVQRVFSFVAIDTTTTLRFRSLTTGNAGAAIDNVRVELHESDPPDETDPPVGIVSTFDSDAENWVIEDVDQNTLLPVQILPVQWSVSGGNPEGHIFASDQSGFGFTFAAPSPFLGSKSSSIGGVLTFDLRTNVITTDNKTLVTLRGKDTDGSDLILTYDAPTLPQSDFTSYTIPLVSDGWEQFLSLGSFTEATPQQFEQVMSNLSALLIRGDWINGSETTYIDNVKMSGFADCSLDIDGNGVFDALTDGIVIIRFAFGFRGDTLIYGKGLVDPADECPKGVPDREPDKDCPNAIDVENCTRCTSKEIEAYMEKIAP